MRDTMKAFIFPLLNLKFMPSVSSLLRLFTSVVISLSVSFSALSQGANTTDKLTENLPKYSKVYDDKSDPFSDANAALALAKATNRQVLIEIGGNWCTWCHKMDTFLANNNDVYQALHEQYVLLKINVSDSNENQDFMDSLPPVLGYPHMYVSTASGKMLLSKDTAELLSGDNYSREHWITFLNKWSIHEQAKQEQNISNTTTNAGE